jgi:UDP-glucose:(heptosyl)LPS alpha-1,3-glucosyltransferase
MAEGLAARGHELHVFCARTAGAPAHAHVHRVPLVRGGRTIRLLSFAIAAPRAAARARCDLVVGFGRTLRQDVVRVGGGTHRSYLAHMRAAGVRGQRIGPYHRVVLWLEGRMFAAAAEPRVLAVSRQAGAEIQCDYGVPADRLRVVYNGVDLDRFRPCWREGDAGPLRRELNVRAGERLVLGVGSGFVRKGFDLLLDLWRDGAPPEAQLALVGRDERLGRYRRAATTLGRRVHVLGPRDDVPQLMATADVVCVPSRQEAFGNVVLEALASGTPVVTSRLVGAAELLAPPLDALVIERPDDRAALRGALARALGDDHDRYATAARAAAEERPWSKHLDEIERVFGEWARGR